MIIDDEILIRYLDDQLDEESCREVAEAIVEEEDVALRLLELSEHEVMLQETVEVMAEASDIVTQTRKNKRLRKGGLPRTAVITGICLAAAACLAVALFMISRPDQPESKPGDNVVQGASDDVDPLLLVPIEEAPGSELLPLKERNKQKPAKRMQVIRGRILSIDSANSRIEVGVDSGELRSLKITQDTVIVGYSNLLGPIDIDDRVQAALVIPEDGIPQLKRLVVRPPANRSDTKRNRTGNRNN